MAANCATIKGYSAAPDIAFLVNALRLKMAQLAVHPWFDFVSSETNLPSQGDFEVLLSMGASRIPFLMPPCHSWASL